MPTAMRVGLTLLKNEDDSPLSPHFGTAKWLGIYDAATGTMHFERNTGLYGGFVADALARAGCTHAVFAHIGGPALEHLRAHGIRAFWGEPGQPATELVARLERGELRAAESSDDSGGQAHYAVRGH